MTARAIRVLLPTSKHQAEGGSGPPWRPGTCALPALDDARAAVLGALSRAMDELAPDDLRKLLDAQGPTLDAAAAANSAVLTSPTRPAIERYTGVLYDELAYAGLPAAARRRVDRTVLVFSAAFGVVAARDPLPLHRLDFGARLPGVGAVTAWWRPRITEALRDELAGRVVWDLLPGAHSAAWDPQEIGIRRRVTVRFVDAGGLTISHWNKLLKGALVQWMARTGATEPEELVGFEHRAGFRFDEKASWLTPERADVVLRDLG